VSAHDAGSGALAGNVNYDYFVDYVRRATERRPGLRVLDFGCGRGEMVSLIRGAGFDCCGADVFYEGADWHDPELRRQLDEGLVREIGPDGRLPFDDASFDLVISNQVVEHVEDLEAVLAETTRVLRSGGSQYHHFPSRGVVREGHIGIPMAHWIKPGPLRTRYTLTMRRLGFGSHKEENPDPRAWTDFKLDWIDRYCFYRPYGELAELFGREYEIAHREIDYCRFRARGRPALERALALEPLAPLAQWMLREFAFMAIELRLRR
jgi:SAM-dependent methyltransferase